MFKHRSLKKYTKKLRPTLEKRYGKQAHYSASQVRSTVYQCNFKCEHLPLGYMLALNKDDLTKVAAIEFPETCLKSYKQDISIRLKNKKLDITSLD